MQKLTENNEIEQRQLIALPTAHTFANRSCNPDSPPPTYNETLEPLELLTQEMSHHNSFTIGQPTFVNGITVVSIFGPAQQPILTVFTTPLANTSVNKSSTLIPCSSVIEVIVDEQLVITGMENAQSVIISSGEEILGKLVKNTTMDYSFLVRNAMGNLMFQSDEMLGLVAGSPTEIVVRIREKTLARIRKSESNLNQYEVLLFDSQNLDPRTKALLIFTSYFSCMTFIQPFQSRTTVIQVPPGVQRNIEPDNVHPTVGDSSSKAGKICLVIAVCILLTFVKIAIRASARTSY